MRSLNFSIDEIAKRLPLPATEKWPEGVWFTDVLLHGTMLLLLFTPRSTDYQSPHEQDEIYVVARGRGTFVGPDGMAEVSQGDALFVPAREPHHFENVSDDFATWAILWGPPGGEDGDEGPLRS
jgi:mannose-6-phosphate isomerase-like protein (cupin superfamily)